MNVIFQEAMAEVFKRAKVVTLVDDVGLVENELYQICENYRKKLTLVEHQQVVDYAKQRLNKIQRLH